MLSVALFLSSDDEDEYTVPEMNATRRQIRQQSNIFSMPNSKLNKEAFKYVLNKITPKLKEAKRSSAVPNVLKLAATMRILDEGSYQKGAGNDYNVEVFDVLFIREQEKRHVVHCMSCARKQSPNFHGIVCLEEYRLSELCQIYDAFSLHKAHTLPQNSPINQ